MEKIVTEITIDVASVDEKIKKVTDAYEKFMEAVRELDSMRFCQDVMQVTIKKADCSGIEKLADDVCRGIAEKTSGIWSAQTSNAP